MEKTERFHGIGVITTDPDENGKLSFEFLPDDSKTWQFNACQSCGSSHLLRGGEFYFESKKKRVRDNSLLICKAAHGRLSSTRDKAVQLTLKAFACEGIDWQRTFVKETVEVMANLMGEDQMADYLFKLAISLKYKNV